MTTRQARFLFLGASTRLKTWAIFTLAMAFTGTVLFATNVSFAGFVSGFGPSNVDALFGSQSDFNQQTNPTGLPNPWTAVGTGGAPYFPLTALPNIPGAPPATATPSNVTPFAGTPSTSSFSFGTDSATSKIVGTISGPGFTVDDAQLNLQMILTQGTPFTQYTYEQLNFAIDYTVTNTTNSAFQVTGPTGATVSRSFLVTGNNAGSSNFATFGGEIDYWDVAGGVPSALGSLTFAYTNNTPGPFSSVVTGSGFINGPVNNPDVLRLTGSFFVIADPATITVESLPEPSTLVLAALGALGLAGVAWRRRKTRYFAA